MTHTNSLVLASGNAGKIKELQVLLPNYTLIPQTQFNVCEIDETGTTFVENAILKARHASKISKLPAIADDSGLVVAALNDKPAIYSARYAGQGATDSENIARILHELDGVPAEKRQAYFFCVLVFMRHANDPCPIIAQGRWDGFILEQPKGEQGFGYDPIFGVATHHCSAAELTMNIKNSLSHRGKALAQLQFELKADYNALHSQSYFSQFMTSWLNDNPHLLSGGFKGIEKESLRINAQGLISQTLHPHALGSTLTHSQITTDYSEALIELITPPFADICDTLKTLQNIHQFVYENLDNEQLLCASMPCGIDGDESIRIAEYGSSNIGRMKHVYRHGLWHRYGRTMQAIAGIHFNYSVPQPLWLFLYEKSDKSQSLTDFKNATYFGLIRNFQRIGWLILYLFGASPAICKNFFKSRPALMAQFEEFDNSTLYHPYATSLRMSDIGYKSKNQADLAIDYNSIDGYVESLGAAISTPYAEYEKIGVNGNGKYKQLNANILQIENEFYSIMRPKQIALSGEKPTSALRRGGVEYVEMRALDLNPFQPLGIDEPTARFIEALLLTCLLTDSPEITANELRVNNSNQLIVANSGRKPNVELVKNGDTITLQNWAREILSSIQPICEALDSTETNSPYSQTLKLQRELVENSDLTPSAKMLAAMREHKKSFSCFTVNQSAELAKIFAAETLDETTRQNFIKMATESHAKQRELEAAPQLPFEQFLKHYFAQS